MNLLKRRSKQSIEAAKQEAQPVKIDTSGPLKVLYFWNAPARPFKERDKQYFSTIFIMIFVISLILVFIKEFLLIGVVLSITFVYYVLSTIPPEKIDHKITTKGVVYAGTSYPWENLISFFYTEKFDKTILNINTKERFPGRMFMLIDLKDKTAITKILSKYVEEVETPKESVAEKLAAKASQKLSLE